MAVRARTVESMTRQRAVKKKCSCLRVLALGVQYLAQAYLRTFQHRPRGYPCTKISIPLESMILASDLSRSLFPLRRVSRPA